MASRWCSVCDWRLASRKGRCDTCYRYWRRTGQDRPEKLLVREGLRWLEKG